MRKFITNMLTRLTGLKTGIHANAGDWTGQPVQETDIDGQILLLNGKEAEIDAAEDALKLRQSEGHTLVNTADDIADQAESLARGIHQQNPVKLTEYNIKQRKAPAPKNPPGMAVIASLADDSDGIGFVITTQALAYAETFDIERAVTEADVMTATVFSHLKTTQKLTYIDDEVITGKRHHYRVRASNRKGSGPVSASVSAIQ